MKEISELPPTNETEILASSLTHLVKDMGLGEKVRITTRPVRSGGQQIEIISNRALRAAWGSGLEQLRDGQFSLLLKFIARTLAESGRSTDTIDLLRKQEFSFSCLAETTLSENSKGNKFLTELIGASDRVIPCLYGSTNGLNFAELLETTICASAIRDRGLDSVVIFDTSGNNTEHSRKTLSESVAVLPDRLKKEYPPFLESLGASPREQRSKAAKRLLAGSNIVIIPSVKIFSELGNKFSVGKLAVLAKIAGEDPLLFKRLKTSELLASCNQSKSGLRILRTSVYDMNLEPAGFTYYAREAVIAGDFPGLVALPLKLTSHANIYKILGGYGSLSSQNQDGGAVLCPIMRQRIQSKRQASEGADPFDVTVLAFLAEKFPSNFNRLRQDFANSCKVLSPTRAMELGTKDKRFIVEDYFSLEKP